MQIINYIANTFLRRHISKVHHFKENPVEVQMNIFKELLAKGKNTEWGRKHHFFLVNNYDAYRETIPYVTYEDILPYIERQMQGEEDVLWPGQIKWFAKSSGTTSSRSKFIPISEESLENCHFECGKAMLAIYIDTNDDAELFNGKSLMMGGSHQVSELNQNSFQGDLSAIIMQNMPTWAQIYRTPSMDVALMQNWDEKIERMAKSAMLEDVTNIAGVPSWTLVLMKRILELTKKETIGEVWPNLELYMHGGVSFIPYREQFKKIIGLPNMRFQEIYNASEGFFAIQDTENEGEMLLMLDYGIFYEFVPVEELETENPKFYHIGEVEKDKIYAICITTNGGLWRYMPGDTIRFTNLKPYRIKIAGRTKHYINAFGEELIIENAENALTEACLQTNASIKEYTAGPVFMDGGNSGAHEWLIEFEKDPDDMEIFGKVLDETLKKLNSDYDAKRFNNYILKKPLIKVLPQETFYKWLKSKDKLGGQNKVPRLANDRKFLDELTQYLT
jgi:hypothetical protein